jgi:uncharacterized metal-binding protein YceD (DUF177 family)
MSRDFGLRLPMDQIHEGKRIDLVADDQERAAIAKRLGLVSINRLEAHAVVERDGPQVRAAGRIKAALEQSCVASGEPVRAHVDEPFQLVFVPEPSGRPDEEVELGPEDLDVVFHDGAAIELGSAIADTLALALDPFPRGPNADVALKAAGILSEEQAGPFAALAKLKGETPDAT